MLKMDPREQYEEPEFEEDTDMDCLDWDRENEPLMVIHGGHIRGPAFYDAAFMAHFPDADDPHTVAADRIEISDVTGQPYDGGSIGTERVW
ncbi:MAG: hypothetical protein ABIH92_03775 [Nanoarchaeota archaeon]